MLTSKFTLSLVFYITVALMLSAHASNDVHRRHGDLNRMIKRRSPISPNLGAIGAAADPNAGSVSSNSQTSTGTGTSQSASSTPAVKSSSSTSTTPTPIISASPSSQSNAASSSSASSISSDSAPPSTITSSASSAIAASLTTPSASLNFSPLPSASFGQQNVSQVFITSTDSASAASATSSATPASDTSKHTTITVLIIIGASVAGVAVIWTIIRKWKFKPSSQFEDRMQPIDWQPTSGSDEGGVAGHRRIGSGASSFLSGSGHGHDILAGRGAGGYGSTSDQGHGASLNPIPDHDFTAGTAGLAPVGGYADLSRGASPQPQMQQMHQYDQYGVPVHHQGYVQDAYDYNGGTY